MAAVFPSAYYLTPIHSSMWGKFIEGKVQHYDKVPSASISFLKTRFQLKSPHIMSVQYGVGVFSTVGDVQYRGGIS